MARNGTVLELLAHEHIVQVCGPGLFLLPVSRDVHPIDSTVSGAAAMSVVLLIARISTPDSAEAAAVQPVRTTTLPKNTDQHAGQACIAARTTASSSARVAPSTACTDKPCRMVA